MKKERLYQVEFITKSNGTENHHYIQLVSDSNRNAILETRKAVFNNTGKHAFRCKAKLVSL